MISVGLAFWSAMTALSGTAKTFGALLTFRVGVGIGEASATPAALIVELVKFVEAHNLTLEDIVMKRPTLEDVFIELTGKNLRES